MRGVLLLLGLGCHSQAPSPEPVQQPARRAEAGAEATSTVVAPDSDPRAATPDLDFRAATDAALWQDGRVSRLRTRALRAPQHDGDLGATRLELDALAPGSAPDRVWEKGGVWRTVAYVEETSVYLIAGLLERGAWLPIDVLVYVDERTGAWRDSHVQGTRWMAMAAVASPRGRYVAFVADAGGDAGFELEVLDTRGDVLVRAGDAPAPPPAGGDCEPAEEPFFTWGAPPADGYVDLDPGIIVFAGEDTLVASYGRDRCTRRAAKRREQRWELPALFARGPRVVPGKYE